MADVKSKLHLSVITPAKAYYEGDASYVQIPVSDGLIGVLPGHSPYVGLLGFGILTLLTESKEEQKIVIDGGFLEIKDNRVTVLANSADSVASINEGDARKKYDEALAMKPRGEVETDLRQERLAAARTRLHYLGIKH